jgi:PIN like domain
MSFVSTPPPPELPPFFLDRNIGSVKVPAGLRALGVQVVTLSERYGIHEGERIEDIEWMLAARSHGRSRVDE